jgi:hypothetical protein
VIGHVKRRAKGDVFATPHDPAPLQPKALDFPVFATPRREGRPTTMTDLPELSKES